MVSDISLVAFEKYRATLRGQPLSAVWRGHGSSIFLEFGRLLPRRTRVDSFGNPQGEYDPQGEYTVMIEWSWRIESENAILCGSWSDEENWEGVFKSLVGRKVLDVSVYGRLPELSIALSGGIYVASFMTAEGQPMWTILDHSAENGKPASISVENGRIVKGL